MTKHIVKIKKSTGRILPVLILIIICITAVYNYLSDDKNAAVNVPSGTAQLHFIDVGQGDSILIVTADGNMLIDAGSGESEASLKKYLDKLGISQLEYAVFTHPHEDHIGGADMIFQNYEVNNVILPDAVSTTLAYKNMLDGIEKSNADVHQAVSGDEYSFGGVNFKILAPNSSGYSGFNDYSAVVRITYGNTSFIMTGDAEALSESEILARYSPAELDCDVLKVGHHGSDSSSSDGFLAALTPAVSVISCGEGNSYGHPHSETLTRLEGIGSTILRTDKSGTIVLQTDGNEVRLMAH